MAYWDVFVTKWGTLNPGTTAQKLAQLNAITVAAAQPAIVDVNKIKNAIVAADFTSLTQLQVSQMSFLLTGNSVVDASPGTMIRAVFQSIFAGKATTLANLSALVSPFDNATIPWTQANGYPTPASLNDTIAAGVT